MSLQLEEHTIAGGSRVTVQVHGDVELVEPSDSQSVCGVAATLGTVLIDLRAVPFMDSAGLGAVIFGIRQARTTGAGSPSVSVQAAPWSASCRSRASTGSSRS